MRTNAKLLRSLSKSPQSEGGAIEIENKQSRLDQLRCQVAELRQHFSKTISGIWIESLKGRLLHASGQTFGMCTQLACQLVHRFSGSGASVKATAELVHAASEALELLCSSKPRLSDRWSSMLYRFWSLQMVLWKATEVESPMVHFCWVLRLGQTWFSEILSRWILWMFGCSTGSVK